jgi:MoxR-like ATPase
VPGLAKTLTVKTMAEVLGGTFRRVQFTPDLVPADLVGTRIYRPDTGRFDIELGPVFGNFLLADEINRAPAKVQSALLEVMQEQQVTIGGETFPVPQPFLVMATQNPIESEGTYPLPEAQVDRFLMKVVVDYPSTGEESAVVGRSLDAFPEVRERLSLENLERYSRATHSVFVDRRVIGYAVALADATRNPADYGLDDLVPYIAYGASPRGPIGLVHAARALAMLRGRGYVNGGDVRDLAPDVLRHRIVLSYDALSEGVTADTVLDRVLDAVPEPEDRYLHRTRSHAA